MWEHLIPALIDLIEGTLLLCSKVDSDLGLGDATYRILSCLITRRFPSRLYPIVDPPPWTQKKTLIYQIRFQFNSEYIAQVSKDGKDHESMSVFVNLCDICLARNAFKRELSLLPQVGKVSHGLGKVSDGLGKVSDGLGKVSDGLG